MPEEDQGYRTFQKRMLSLAGIDLGGYKPKQMARRIRSLMERRGARSFHEYYRLLSRDPKALKEFIDRTTINVSELFRNPEKFAELRDRVLPELLARRRDLRIWSAGCSYGAEPYSMAMILVELTPGRRHKIVGTDTDERVLAQAREGFFSRSDLKEVSPETAEKYFDREGEGFRLKSRYRGLVEFRKHDLLADAYDSDCDLISCRNVVIYFTDEAKDRVYRGFFESLRPGGYLFVGGTERIANCSEIGFETPRPFFYRKPRGESGRLKTRAA